MKKKKINFKVLGKIVIVLKPEVKEETESGIYKGENIIKEEKKLKESEYLEVIGVGDEITKVKLGDMILVNGTITGVVIDGIECGVLYEPSIIGIKS
jgi:DNA polymerase II small subunit/DNA polymerase delta subunit B